MCGTTCQQLPNTICSKMGYKSHFNFYQFDIKIGETSKYLQTYA